MKGETLILQPGKLWERVTEQTQHALSSGALHPIPTQCEFVEQDGIRFLVRIVSNLARKDKAKKNQHKATGTKKKDFNPFLPYEPDLFVADISDTHLCLLNKFNVVDYHLLIVTREFEEQETLLTKQDFAAMWATLAEIDGLVFYNAGQVAGASQRHKHLQLIPLPLAPEGSRVPIEPVLASAIFQNSVGTIPSFPFRHAFIQLDASWAKSPLSAASSTLDCYDSLLGTVGLKGDDGVSGSRQPGGYNLLATREWMLMVPREQERFESLAINSLGFAGAMLVRNEQQMQVLKDYGPMTVLKNVAVPGV